MCQVDARSYAHHPYGGSLCSEAEHRIPIPTPFQFCRCRNRRTEVRTKRFEAPGRHDLTTQNMSSGRVFEDVTRVVAKLQLLHK